MQKNFGGRKHEMRGMLEIPYTLIFWKAMQGKIILVAAHDAVFHPQGLLSTTRTPAIAGIRTAQL